MPSTLTFNWKSEIEKFYPSFKVLEYSGQDRKLDLSKADVVLISYDILRRDISKLQSKKFHVIIFDEAQFMKNMLSKRSSSARKLKGEFKITLTGTPLENHLGEYYSVMDLSVSKLFGSYSEFKDMLENKNHQRLHQRAKPFILRRTKERILKDLPPKQESEIYFDMTKKQKAVYHKVTSQVRKKITQAFKTKKLGQANLLALTAILRLRQICVSPGLIDKKWDETSPKIDYLMSKLQEVTEEEHRVLVFSQFTTTLDILESELTKRNLSFFRMDGKTPKATRKTIVDHFQCGAGAPIFLISLKTGGVGLNLTEASYVFHVDPWWHPAVENQASDRVHRIGQTKNVFISRLIMRGTIEEKMMSLKAKKQKMMDRILTKASKSVHSGLTKEDFEFLLD